MGVQKLTTRGLDPAERIQLEEALRDPARFHSDGREVTIFVFGMTLLLLGPLVVLISLAQQLTVYPDDPTVLERLADFPSGWWALLRGQPEMCGAVVVGLVQLALVHYGVRTYGRHGHVLAPFGVVRIRGPALRLLRYADIEGITVIERRPPQYSVATTELELKAKDGTTMSLFGYGVTRMRPRIEAAIAAART